MHFSLRAATLAAFAITAVGAAMASDATLAGIAASSTDTIPAAIRAPQDGAAPANPSATSRVVFGATKEVVQPLASEANATTASTSELSLQDVAPAASLADLVDDHGAPEVLDNQMQCLAGAVYFEAKGETLAGQLAVARVIINRVSSGRFANSLCGVVYQPGQFSFVRGHSMPSIATAGRAWREAVAISQIAFADAWKNVAEGALYFHARRVSPGWNRQRVALIDNHIFYR
jgi:spore germination cell wall hydrolase CwlJ-like protein